MFEKFKENLEKIKKGTPFKIFLVVIVSAFVLVALLSIFKKKSTQDASVAVSFSDYAGALEKELENKLSEIDGVGKVSVILTVDGCRESIIAKDVTTTTDASGTVTVKETPVLVNGKPVVLKELYPEIIGIVVICEGAKNIITTQKIQNAITTIADIEVNKIEIISMK